MAGKLCGPKRSPDKDLNERKELAKIEKLFADLKQYAERLLDLGKTPDEIRSIMMPRSLTPIPSEAINQSLPLNPLDCFERLEHFNPNSPSTPFITNAIAQNNQTDSSLDTHFQTNILHQTTRDSFQLAVPKSPLFEFSAYTKPPDTIEMTEVNPSDASYPANFVWNAPFIEGWESEEMQAVDDQSPIVYSQGEVGYSNPEASYWGIS